MNPNLNRGPIGNPNSGHHQETNSTQQQQATGIRISGSAVPMSSHHTTFVPPQSVGGINQQQPLAHHNVHNQNQQIDVAASGAYYNQQQPQLGRQARTATPIQPQQPVVSQQQQMRNKKLQVDDALSYLERVRQQFANTPDKYNDFLEVMKNFKSQKINTQGVILNVSSLFRDFPDLISGFNTFLPPGYQVRVDRESEYIEIIYPTGSVVINNAHDQQVVVNTTSTLGASGSQMPSVVQDFGTQQTQVAAGSTSKTIAGHGSPNPKMKLTSSPRHKPNELSSPVQPMANLSIEQPQQIQEPANVHHRTILSRSAAHPQMQTVGSDDHPQQIAQPTQSVTTATSAAAAANATALQQQQAQLAIDVATQQSQQQPIHFDQALGYLNKIKERFSSKPEIYNQFLAILSNYQRVDGSQKLTESGVYQEVSKLFHHEADLMRDFKSFLPDAGLERAEERLNRQLQSELGNTSSRIGTGKDQNGSGEPGGESGKSTLTATNSAVSNKKRSPESEHATSKKSKLQTKITYNTNTAEILNDLPLKDFIFYQKVHNALQSETIFQNFLRFLALHTKSLISRGELLDLVTPFLAPHPELLKQMKDILGGEAEIRRQPPMQHRLDERLPMEKAHQIDFTLCKTLGVNYKSVPEDQQPKCSGRTELCKRVLNDKWVCFPTWASEDAAVTAKKSAFEEVMCRTEDERFEVDILIETNSSAISALEYARSKIESMGNEETAKKWMGDAMEPTSDNFAKLGCSFTVISRAVKKLYGEHAKQILTALEKNPLTAIKVLLERMHARDTEWKQARDEYNTIWRDQVEKNYLKSLDHQALTFKANDGKSIRSHTIINQLETLYDERREKAEQGLPYETGPHMLIEYPDDMQVFMDANELISHYVNRNFSTREKTGINDLLQQMIPRLCMLKVEPFPTDQDLHETSFQSNGVDNTGENGFEKSDAEMEETGAKDGAAELVRSLRRSRRQSISDAAEKGDDSTNGNEMEATAQLLQSTSQTQQQRPQFIIPQQRISHIQFFGTKSWLLFLRLHAILCTRLALIKKRTEILMEEYNAEMRFQERQRETFKKHGKSVESQLLNAVDVHYGLRELKKSTQNPENFYQIMLQEMKNLLDGTIDTNNFEDTLRSMFDTRAYVLFTMDKLISAITKHLKNFVSDSTSTKCVNLFKEYYAERIDERNLGDQALMTKVDLKYEEAAEKLLINQNCYKMFFFLKENRLLVTLELIDTLELPESDSDEDEEQESCNVVALPDWADFLKKSGVNYDELMEKQEEYSHQNLTRRIGLMNRNLRQRMALFRANTANEELHGNNNTNGSKEKEGSGVMETASAKHKIPQFFASRGFCELLRERDPVRLFQEVSAGENVLEPDVFIRKGASGVSRKGYKKVFSARRKRWTNWLEKCLGDTDVSARWLTTGCDTMICQHPRFKYLKYTKYMSSSHSN